MRRLTIAVLSLTLLLTGCAAQLGYRYADTLVEWQLDEYVELNSDQQQQASQVIEELHQWHATTELPKYREALLELRTLIAEQSLKQEHIGEFEDQLRQSWSNIQQRVVKHTDLLNELTPEQRKQLISNLYDNIKEEREERADDDSSELLAQIERVNRREERLEEWTGEVTGEQKFIMREWVKAQPDGSFWLDYRERWTAEFETVLLKQPIPQQPLNRLVTDPRHIRSDAHNEFNEKRRAVRHEYFWKLYQSLNQQQREKLVDKADEYLELLSDLIADFDNS
ncbi:MAG: DUF6279 family lipoprotein [Pseudomonadota bacterium]